MKYIVIKTFEGEELLMVFPSVMVHKEVFETIQSMKVENGQSWSRPHRSSECIAAGFITYDGYCHGHSESLGVDSREEIDTELFKSQK